MRNYRLIGYFTEEEIQIIRGSLLGVYLSLSDIPSKQEEAQKVLTLLRRLENEPARD